MLYKVVVAFSLLLLIGAGCSSESAYDDRISVLEDKVYFLENKLDEVSSNLDDVIYETDSTSSLSPSVSIESCKAKAQLTVDQAIIQSPSIDKINAVVNENCNAEKGYTTPTLIQDCATQIASIVEEDIQDQKKKIYNRTYSNCLSN